MAICCFTEAHLDENKITATINTMPMVTAMPFRSPCWALLDQGICKSRVYLAGRSACEVIRGYNFMLSGIVWVLRRLFNRSRSEIADHIEKLLSAETLNVQNEQEVFSAMIDLRDGAGTFEDGLIGMLGIWAGCSTTLTFDEKAARRLRGFRLV
jgi:predicted nucleic-acid-binding protein